MVSALIAASESEGKSNSARVTAWVIWLGTRSEAANDQLG